MVHRRFHPSPNELPALIGRSLRALRLRLGCTQAQFAERIGLSDEAYARIERGRAIPRADTLVRLAQETGASLDGLLLGDAGAEVSPDVRAAVVAVLHGATEEELQLLQHLACGLKRLRRQKPRASNEP